MTHPKHIGPYNIEYNVDDPVCDSNKHAKRKRLTPEEMKVRNALILELHAQGLNAVAIAAQVGLEESRVRDIVSAKQNTANFVRTPPTPPEGSVMCSACQIYVGPNYIERERVTFRGHHICTHCVTDWKIKDKLFGRQASWQEFLTGASITGMVVDRHGEIKRMRSLKGLMQGG